MEQMSSKSMLHQGKEWGQYFRAMLFVNLYEFGWSIYQISFATTN